MFAKRQNAADTTFEEFKTHLLQSFKDDEVPVEEFTKILAEFNKFAALHYAEKRSQKVSPDVLATVGGNLAGILLILNYERVGIVTSKALGFVQKLR